MTSPVAAAKPRHELRSPGIYTGAIIAAVTVLGIAFAFGLDAIGHPAPAPAGNGVPALQRTLAGHDLAIPPSLFRFAGQRVEGAATQLDLRFSLHLQPDDATRLVDVTLVPSDGVRSSARLLEEVYGPRFSEGELAGPDGLVGREIGAPEGDTVWYDQQSGDPFVAKCDAAIARGVQPRCLRTVHAASGIAATYAFDFELLERWREFDAAVEPWLETIGIVR
ncbi:MAG TPA: hypothetical protein PK286_11630 [Devosia sp.]|nr:hypothetical protein [Devosia sp.]